MEITSINIIAVIELPFSEIFSTFNGVMMRFFNDVAFNNSVHSYTVKYLE